MKRKKKEGEALAAVCQLRSGSVHPFGAVRSFVPLGGGEEQIYRQMREAIPVLDAAVSKMVRLCGGFEAKCVTAQAQEKLNAFLKSMPCGRGPGKETSANRLLISFSPTKYGRGFCFFGAITL